MKSRILSLVVVILCNGAFLTSNAVANPISPPAGAITGNRPPPPPTIIPPAPSFEAKSYILMDADSGQVIAAKNMHHQVAPASLTKLMTLYVISDALKSGQIHFNDPVPVSQKAWRTGGSKMFIQVGTNVPIKDLIQGIVVASGNDATVAMAEYLGGSEDGFATIMNHEAAKLGMINSHFSDANGLPSPQHYSSAYDLAILSRALIKHFPEYYPWYKQKSFNFNNITQPNRNRLLWQDPSVDGLKTGFTDDAGYCLVASAKRGDNRLISVVMGAPNVNIRAVDTESLLNYGFRFFETHKLYTANAPVTEARVWQGTNKKVALGTADDLYITIPKGLYKNLQAQVKLTNMIKAPVQRGGAYGSIIVTLNGKVLATKPLIALQDDPRGGLWTRMNDSISLAIHRFFSKD